MSQTFKFTIMYPPFLFLLLLFFFLPINNFILITSAKFHHHVPRLSPTGPRTWERDEHESILISELDMETYFYNQTLDHFNFNPESFDTFQQRYVISSKFWGGRNSNSPMFVYLGAEAPLDNDLSVIGFLTDNAARFSALLVYIEHRYYGKSIPFGSREEALKNASTRGYFNSVQAIADCAEIILHIKDKFQAQDSPVIVLGGSYGGMLASWFRLKYPHIALGALASSAPILYFDDITPNDGYYSIVTKDFREASETCYQTIVKSWAEIDDVASKPNGFQILSNKFKTCKALESSDDLKDRLETMYSSAAQYNRPPKYPVNIICKGIDDENANANDTLSKIFGGVVAYNGNKSCYINPPTNSTETSTGWRWQTCSEMVIPIGRGNETMFQAYPFNLSSYIEDCKDFYGVSPRPHWVTTYYGGHSIKLILQRFGSNIIFSNGLRDPYSSGGVLEDISDTILAVSTVNGSHCLDIVKANATTDPDWLVAQRQTEINIIDGWINKYYDDLLQLNTTSPKIL